MMVLHLDYDGVWVEAELKADPETWSRALVVNRYLEEGLALDEERAEVLSSAIASALGLLLTEQPPPDLALLLYPQADRFIITCAALRYKEIDSQIGLDEAAKRLCLPTEMLERPVETTTMDTASGPALRLAQRYLTPVAQGVEQIREHLAYVWTFNHQAGSLLVILSTTFEDLVDAGDWRPDLDELASALVVQAD
jgi:hypothetical protein